MSVYPVDPATPLVDVDAAGKATLRHTASHHVTYNGLAGEVTLCGRVIVYDTWNGAAPDAPVCQTCDRLDS